MMPRVPGVTASGLNHNETLNGWPAAGNTRKFWLLIDARLPFPTAGPPLKHSALEPAHAPLSKSPLVTQVVFVSASRPAEPVSSATPLPSPSSSRQLPVNPPNIESLRSQ